ncbi:MAG TPA: hypothetical protein VFX86_04280 [Candidatus Saccharimonadales bacterium]|nr:hypothetical protein [Candidatus Saccharimonadales bacterium]
MPRPKTYFHDRLILLILSINTFLAIALVLSSLFALSDNSAVYIREYRSNLGLDGYEAGGFKDVLAFAIFSVILYAFQIYASTRIYHIRQHISLMILLLVMVIYIFALLVLNALLGLR